MKGRGLTTACLLSFIGFLACPTFAKAYDFEVSAASFERQNGYTDFRCALDIEPVSTEQGYPDDPGYPDPGYTTLYDASGSCWFIVRSDRFVSPLLIPDSVSVYTYNNGGQYVDYVYVYWRYGNLVPDAKVCWYFEGNQEVGYQVAVELEHHNLGSGFCTPL